MVSSSNKQLLVDTHIILWALENTSKLGPKTTASISSADQVYVSVVSLWELAAKYKAGKLPYASQRLQVAIEMMGMQVLALRHEHIIRFEKVMLPHKDPFDALLLAQSLSENLSFVTADQAILSSRYESIIDARV